jgi:hypothetical protein
MVAASLFKAPLSQDLRRSPEFRSGLRKKIVLLYTVAIRSNGDNQEEFVEAGN